MRVLWFSVTPSMYNSKTNGHNGAGWIASLEAIIRKADEVQLGIAFEYPDKGFRYDKDDVSYYPIYREKGFRQKLLQNKDSFINSCLAVIEDFKPDIIQIFGSENDFGLLCQHTSIPIIIHIQGSLIPYYNALFPVGLSKSDFLFSKGLSLKNRYVGLKSEPSFKKRAKQEELILKSCRYFMGRTDWDKNLISLINPSATYFHCEEVLRDSFIQGAEYWKYKTSKEARIISVISTPWYKGLDLILKTAKLLTDYTNLKFEWNVYGVKEIKFFESKYGISANKVGIKIRGTASKEVLVKVLLDSSCYVHPSYIDNSPNSLCEAQILGIPVLATYVGGIPSMVENNETGLLFPANDPFTLSGLIQKVVLDETIATHLSIQEMQVATQRHNPNSIKDKLLSIYNTILNNK